MGFCRKELPYETCNYNAHRFNLDSGFFSCFNGFIIFVFVRLVRAILESVVAPEPERARVRVYFIDRDGQKFSLMESSGTEALTKNFRAEELSF